MNVVKAVEGGDVGMMQNHSEQPARKFALIRRRGYQDFLSTYCYFGQDVACGLVHVLN